MLCCASRGERLKHLFSTAVLISLFTFPIPSIACSMASCVNNGDEMRRDFVVRITYADKPLSGVSVQITGTKSFSATSSTDGTVNVSGLPPGDYWLNTDLLGISAGGQCFHVNSRSSRKARRMVRYEWGDLAPGIRRVAGKLIDSQPSQDGNPLWNVTHRLEAPISDAALKLQNPFTGQVFRTTSNHDGDFSFDAIPSGRYVLHVEGGTTRAGGNYESTDQLINISETARPSSLALEWRESGGGSCGGASLQLRDSAN
jgi:carboxypeptidase family protein